MRVTVAAWARAEGITRQAAGKLVKSGVVKVGRDGLVDPAEATRQRRGRTDPSRIGGRGRPGPNGHNADLYQDAKAAAAMLDVQLKQIELRRQLGELHESAPCRKQGYDEARRARDQLYAMASRVSPLVGGMDARAAYRLICSELRVALQELKGWREVEGHDREGAAGGGGGRGDDADPQGQAAMRSAGGGADHHPEVVRAPAVADRGEDRGGPAGAAAAGPGEARRAGDAEAAPADEGRGGVTP